MDTTADNQAFCSIHLDRQGNVVEVRDSEGKPRPIKKTDDRSPAVVGQPAPSGKKIKYVVCIEVVTVENEGEDHDDPCWIRDPRGNWRCVCAPPLC